MVEDICGLEHLPVFIGMTVTLSGISKVTPKTGLPYPTVISVVYRKL
jgi:hypothetical protein